MIHRFTCNLVDCSSHRVSNDTTGYHARGKDDKIFLLEEDQSEDNIGVPIDAATPLLDCSSPCQLECLADSPIETDIWNFSDDSCETSSYLRMISALSPVAYVGPTSFESIKDLTRKYLYNSIEDHVISSLNLSSQSRPADEYSTKFLNLVGFPSFDSSDGPSCVRHPNVSPILGIMKAPGCNYLLGPKAPYSLENILHYSPVALKSDWLIRFLIYQILSALVYIHGLGVGHGNICPSSILLNDSCWTWLSTTDMLLLKGPLSPKVPASLASGICCHMDDCPCRSICTDFNPSASIDWHSNFMRWWKGELSNYEYLLILNRLAGRRWGDHTFHTVMPWVIDFTVKPDEKSDTGWRDLKKSKWRLAKGDEQLDFTFQTSEIPHHVSDECLSELAVCSYKARRLPLRILRSAVRSVYEPNEYPSNMQRLYQWTPDECIPEFYSDPQIFFSLHSEMSDLAIPSWATSPEEFISLHRDALESDRVSRQIHHWIDITFGYKLSGDASIAAKNVMLPISDSSVPRSIGRRQLFTRPHPMRQGITKRSHCNSHQGDCIRNEAQGNKSDLSSSMSSDAGNSLQRRCEDGPTSATCYMENLEEAISFCEHARYLSPVYSFHDIFVESVPYLEPPQTGHPKIVIPESIVSPSMVPSDIDSGLLEYFDANDSGSVGFQDLLNWRCKSSSLGIGSEDLAEDIFSVGCILAELYLKMPLFDPVTFAEYRQSGIPPSAIQNLPPHVAILVKECIQRDWKRYITL